MSRRFSEGFVAAEFLQFSPAHRSTSGFGDRGAARPKADWAAASWKPSSIPDREHDMLSAETLPGGWSAFNFTIPDDVKEVFDQSVGSQIADVNYTPLAYATQIVAGVKYCFLCEGTVATSAEKGVAVKVYILVPIKGGGHVTWVAELRT
jgi:hypothetical protein